VSASSSFHLSFPSFIGFVGILKMVADMDEIVNKTGVLLLLANRGRERFCIRRCVFCFERYEGAHWRW
jgi:hypothetical protein